MRRLLCKLFGHQVDYESGRLDYRGPEPPSPYAIHQNSVLHERCRRCGHEWSEWVSVQG